MPAETHCPYCRAAIPGGYDACHAIFEQVGLLGYQAAHSYDSHRIAVDCYSMQHPEHYARSAKSYTAHLVGLYVYLEYDASRKRNAAFQRWLSANPDIDKPALLKDRGALTILHVHGVEDFDEFALRVRQWAESVWEAYRPQHDLARVWLAAAFSHR